MRNWCGLLAIQNWIRDRCQQSRGRRPSVEIQRLEAISNLGVDEWVLVLCTDEVEHLSLVRAICSEFKSVEKVKVIEPRQALAFYELKSIELASRVVLSFAR